MFFSKRTAAVLLLSTLCFTASYAENAAGAPSDGNTPTESRLAAPLAPAQVVVQKKAWEYGPFINGGVGVTADRYDYYYSSVGFQIGKPISRVLKAGILTGQFEMCGDIMPYWQSFTPANHLETFKGYTYEVNGGTFTGMTITPLILRWNLTRHSHKFLPWAQGAGGILYTTHKYPPAQIVPEGTPGGTSVFNFTPQGGIGVHYFLKPGRSIDLKASAVHISSASLGDKNPGVNASVQFQLGYTWWKVK
jgi:hypothetical protein